jgi:hypothetical protein
MTRHSPTRTLALVAVLALSLVAGCGKDPEAVTVTLDKAKLVIKNDSGSDVYYFLTGYPGVAWIPASLPNIRIRPGTQISRGIDPDDSDLRRDGFIVNWWHEGEKYDKTDIRGADRVRKVRITPQQLAAALPPIPDPAETKATAGALLAACKERVLLEAWASRRARGTEPSETPPDFGPEPVPSGCRDILSDCTKLKTCDVNLARQLEARDAARASTGFQPADYVKNVAVVEAGASPAAAGASVPVASTASTSRPGEIPLTQQLLSVCRERTLLDSWDRTMSRRPGEKLQPPDFSSATIPWGCRDLARDCEEQKSCQAALDEQQKQLGEVRARALRS